MNCKSLAEDQEVERVTLSGFSITLPPGGRGRDRGERAARAEPSGVVGEETRPGAPFPPHLSPSRKRREGGREAHPRALRLPSPRGEQGGRQDAGAGGRLGVAAPRPFRAETKPGHRPPEWAGPGWAGGRWGAPPFLTHAGGPRGEKPGAAAPPPAARAAALAAGGGPCAPLLPLLSSGGARRCLHLPAALPGQSRRRGRRGGGGGGSWRLARPRPPTQRLSHPAWLPPGDGTGRLL